MAVKLYRSDDTGAPTLSGTLGTLLTVLQSVLVDGYNSKTITITRSGTTATATCTAHGFSSNRWISINGANESDYNGEFKITVINANSFSFTVANNPTTPATGTITAKVAPAGWSVGYNTTVNIKSWKSPDTSYYLEAVDTSSSADAGFMLYLYKTSSASSAGTDTTGNGLKIPKSSTISTALQWMIIIGNNGNFIQLYTTAITTASTFAAGKFCPTFIGRFPSLVSGDNYNVLLSMADTASSNPQSNLNCNLNTVTSNFLLMRNYNGTTSNISATLRADNQLLGSINIADGAALGLLAYPDNDTGGLVLQPLNIFGSM